ncbi:hypothetical protein Pfo_027324 [Paulownia fortunei]|nr:hypothetical protein Pfo_027324 [Paulownia fortunei]
MNNTSDSTEESDTNLGGQTIGGFGYGLALSLAVLIIFMIITYASYKCKRARSRATTAPNHRFSASRDDGGSSIVAIQHNGLDEATLSSYPHFTYSQLKPHKNDSTASACSICLADYKESDLLRLLPDCGHLFHLKCIDPWLILHPTCPICRNSPLPTPVQTPLAQPAPVATQ